MFLRVDSNDKSYGKINLDNIDFSIKEKTDDSWNEQFKILESKTLIKVIALGGINYSNFKKLRFTDCYGIASISCIKSYYNGK